MLDRIPKPVVIGAVAVIVVLALMIVFKSVKSAGGAGDYDPAEIRRLAAERANKPNSGRTMPTPANMGKGNNTGGATEGMSSAPGSGGH